MTASRTIPADPKPGERYAEHGPWGWRAWLMGKADGVSSYVIYGLEEPDVRLLIFGPKVIEDACLVLAEEPLEDGQHVRPVPCSATAAEFGEACGCRACAASRRWEAERQLSAVLARLVRADKP